MSCEGAREEREEYFGWLKAEHMLSTAKLVYIGLRDVDAGEKRILREHGIRAFSMFDVDKCVFSLSTALPPRLSPPLSLHRPSSLFCARRD